MTIHHHDTSKDIPMTTATTHDDIEQRIDTAREGFRHLAGLLVGQQAELARLRAELDTAIQRHATMMTVTAIAFDATNLIEVDA